MVLEWFVTKIVEKNQKHNTKTGKNQQQKTGKSKKKTANSRGSEKTGKKNPANSQRIFFYDIAVFFSIELFVEIFLAQIQCETIVDQLPVGVFSSNFDNL